MRDNDLFIRILSFIGTLCLAAQFISVTLNGEMPLIPGSIAAIILIIVMLDSAVAIFRPEDAKFHQNHTASIRVGVGRARHAGGARHEHRRRRRRAIEDQAIQGDTDAFNKWLRTNIIVGVMHLYAVYMIVASGLNIFAAMFFASSLVLLIYRGIKIYSAYRKAWIKNIMGEDYPQNMDKNR